MADPLSVAASVVGLLTAGAQITKVLTKIIKEARDAPDECRKIKKEVDDIRNFLTQLQSFLVGTSRATRSRTSLILVDQVLVTLAACVTTFSELDSFSKDLQSDHTMGILDRLRWSSKDKDIQAVLQRLESHKSSLILMMAILTCQKQYDAEDKVDTLCTLVQRTLEQHDFLRERLTALELRELGCIPTPNLNSAEDQTPAIDNAAKPADGIRLFAFEESLNASRPYRNASWDSDDAFSIVSSAGRTGSWSTLSGLSLSEISHIAILAIPIYPSDISNRDAYIFDMEVASEYELSVSPGSSGDNPALQADGKGKQSMKDRILVLQRGFARATKFEINRRQVFGVPLHESIQYAYLENWRPTMESGLELSSYIIPIVIGSTGRFIKEKGYHSPDLFIQSGHPKRMLQLETTFNMPGSPELYGREHRWAGYTVYDAAGVMLRYLKSLPEPVVPYDTYAQFLRVLDPRVRTRDKDLMILRLCALFRLLPRSNRRVLLYLIDLWKMLCSNFHRNRMTASRLVAAFQPSILSGPAASMDAEGYTVATEIVVFMVEHAGDYMDEVWFS